MLYQKKPVSSKDFFVNYNNKIRSALKQNHFDELVKITKFLETNIKNKKKYLFVEMEALQQLRTTSCVISIKV